MIKINQNLSVNANADKRNNKIITTAMKCS